MSTDELLLYAESHGHTVVYTHLNDTKALSLEFGGSFIALEKTLFGAEEKELAAHELGHCEYGGSYNLYSPYDIKEKAENRANKWAYYKLVPPGELRAALQNGIVEHWELADLFDVSCDFMLNVMDYYKCAGVI